MTELYVQKKKKSKYLVRWFAFFGVYAVMFFSFILLSLIGKSGISNSKPFLSNVCEIAADGEHIYTLDTTFGSICKYKNNGEFVFRINFSGSESIRNIFCDGNGNLCALKVIQREYIVNEYDEFGTIVNQYPVDGERLFDAGIVSRGDCREQTVGTTFYSLHTHMLSNSTIMIKDGDETSEFVIEGIACHLVQGLYMIVMIGFAVIAGINLVKYTWIQQYSKWKLKKQIW